MWLLPMQRPPIQRVQPPVWINRTFNPLMRFLARRSKGLQRYVIILHFRGRKTGRTIDLPVGYQLHEGQILLLTNSGWRHNFAGGQDIEVTYRGRRQPAQALLIADPHRVADFYVHRAAELGLKQTARQLGMKINSNRLPTQPEWVEALRRERMAIVEITLDEKPP